MIMILVKTEEERRTIKITIAKEGQLNKQGGRGNR